MLRRQPPQRGGANGEDPVCRLPVDVAAHRGGRAVLEAALASTPGVLRVQVVASSRAVRVEYDGSVLTAAELTRLVTGLLGPGGATARRTVHRPTSSRRRGAAGRHPPRPSSAPVDTARGGSDAR